jgi:acetyltransferase
VGKPPARFAHLAIRPYPDEFTTEAATPDGLHVVLRPIKPEDEPLWHEMLDACSPESIHSRFRGFVKHTHEMATRFCFIDYDRELALVAEVAENGTHKLAGVGRLVADPLHERAEFALLVADPWQGRGLSEVLTDRCLAVAGAWGVGTVYAETELDNQRMINVMKHHGFEVERRLEDGLVVGERGT